MFFVLVLCVAHVAARINVVAVGKKAEQYFEDESLAKERLLEEERLHEIWHKTVDFSK